MNRFQDQLIAISLRKERLITRAASERVAISANFRRLQGPIGVVDRGLDIMLFFRGHSLLVAAALAAAVAFGRRRLASLAGGALATWRILRLVSRWVA